MPDERLDENFPEQQVWDNDLWFSSWLWMSIPENWWIGNINQQIQPQFWQGQGQPQQENKKLDILDLIILIWLLFFIFILFSIIYTFQWDYISSIVWLLVLIFLFKVFIISKKQSNNFTIFLWLFIFWLYLYFITYYITFWNFVIFMTIWVFTIIFITYYSNFSFDFWKKKEQTQNTLDAQPIEKETEEIPEEEWTIQLWQDIMQDYNQEYSADVEENITNQIVDRVVALLAKWYNIVFSPNTRKIFEFYTIVKTEEVIYPKWLIIWDSKDNKLDNEEENSILEEEDDNDDNENEDNENEENENENEDDNNDDETKDKKKDDDDDWDW